MEKSKTITCRECPFFSGIQCHGHGEYWGNCFKLEEAYRILENRIPKDHYISTGMRDICFEDTECKFISWGLFEVKKL